MSHRFAAMIDRISTFNRFDTSTITKAFLDEVRMNLSSQMAFKKKVQERWEKFTQNKSNVGNYSNFFILEGAELFQDWLSRVFPFSENNRVEFPDSPSPVDIIFNISHAFEPEELSIVAESLQKSGLYIDVNTVLGIIFSNAIKAIGQTISKVFKAEYKIFTDNIDILQKGNKTVVLFKGAGRVQK
ncbi:MAG: hypothetical protein ACTSVY_05670 [Candidatus Helarchaeota archaeon]